MKFTSSRTNSVITGFACILMASAALKADDNSNRQVKVGAQISYASPTGVELKNIVSKGMGFGAFIELPANDKNAFRILIENVSFNNYTQLYDKTPIVGTDASVEKPYDETWGFGVKTRANIVGIKGDWTYRTHSHNQGSYFFLGTGISKVMGESKTFEELLNRRSLMIQVGDNWIDQYTSAPASAVASSITNAMGYALSAAQNQHPSWYYNISGRGQVASVSTTEVEAFGGLGYNFTEWIGLEVKYTQSLSYKFKYESVDYPYERRSSREDWSYIQIVCRTRF